MPRHLGLHLLEHGPQALCEEHDAELLVLRDCTSQLASCEITACSWGIRIYAVVSPGSTTSYGHKPSGAVIAGLGDRRPHLGIGLDVLQVVHDTEVASANCRRYNPV